MYKFSEELIEQAVIYHTIAYCKELDQEFLFRALEDCKQRPALAACFVMDFLDARFNSLYYDMNKKFDAYFQTSTDRH